LEFLLDEVIPDQRFITPGLRNEGGFIGAHDRMTGMPLPDHISANPKDLDSLMGGMIEWRPSVKNNVEVLNDTRDLYRFFDATKQAEFLFECVA
jgi:hypothetical protein